MQTRLYDAQESRGGGGYYTRRLEAQGWAVDDSTAGEDDGEAAANARSIVARRGGLRYSIELLPASAAEGGAGAPARTEVVVAISAEER